MPCLRYRTGGWREDPAEQEQTGGWREDPAEQEQTGGWREDPAEEERTGGWREDPVEEEKGVSAGPVNLRCTSPAPKPGGFGLRLRAKRKEPEGCGLVGTSAIFSWLVRAAWRLAWVPLSWVQSLSPARSWRLLPWAALL